MPNANVRHARVTVNRAGIADGETKKGDGTTTQLPNEQNWTDALAMVDMSGSGSYAVVIEREGYDTSNTGKVYTSKIHQ